jgi:hypothetical protein
MGAESIGHTATILANSAAKTPTSATAPEFASRSAENCEFAVSFVGFLVLFSLLVIFAGPSRSSTEVA